MSLQQKIYNISMSIDDPFFRVLELGKLRKSYPHSEELENEMIRQQRDSIYVFPDKWRFRIFDILNSSEPEPEKLKKLGSLANIIIKESDPSTKDFYKQIILGFIRYVRKTGSYSLHPSPGPNPGPGPIPPYVPPVPPIPPYVPPVPPIPPGSIPIPPAPLGLPPLSPGLQQPKLIRSFPIGFPPLSPGLQQPNAPAPLYALGLPPLSPGLQQPKLIRSFPIGFPPLSPVLQQPNAPAPLLGLPPLSPLSPVQQPPLSRSLPNGGRRTRAHKKGRRTKTVRRKGTTHRR